jgi:general secretion pathway protein F
LAVFEYTALNAKGKKVSGIVDADSQLVAQERLRARKLFPVSLVKIVSTTQDTGMRHEISLMGRFFFSGIKPGEVAMATRLIATLLSAGFPLVSAVKTVAEQTRSRGMQTVLSRVRDAIEEGSSFADALKLYPNVFSSVYINMVAAGETSGTLEIVLDRLADFAERRQETKNKIQAALAYPMIMSAIGFLVLVILLTYIVPGIIQIFSDMNQTLPLPTLILIRVSDFFKAFWWGILLFPVLAAWGIYGVRRTPKGALFTDQITIGLPVAGPLIRKLIAARFSRTLGALLENGVPLLTALKITAAITGNRVISDLIYKAALQVEHGGQLSVTLEENRFFPSLATQMIRVGEQSGEMEKMLVKTADLYEKEVQAAVTAATALVEPVIILVMGVMVGLIVMAVCLPIVEINRLII